MFRTSSTSFNTLERITLRDCNTWCELSRALCFSPKSVSCLEPTPSPGNNDTRPSSSLRMSPTPGDYRCTCRKCGSNGKILPRATWYKHNPGGKKGKAPQLTQEDIASILSRPTPAWGNRRKRTYEEVRAEELLRLSKRATGSSSVCMIRSEYMRLE